MYNFANIDLAKEAEDLRSLEGKERGGHIKYLRNYARLKSGNSGVRAIEDELLKYGIELPDFAQLKNLEWTPSSMPTLYMLAMVKVLGWGKDEIYEMGRELFSFSHPLRFFLKYFVATEKTFKVAAQRWQKSYSFGKMEIDSLDKKGKTVIVRLMDFKKHPVTCIYLQGVFTKIVEIATGSGKASIEETKCIFRGDAYHEYKISWE